MFDGKRGMTPERIQAWIDISRWLEWIFRRLAVIILPFFAIGLALKFARYGKPEILIEAGLGLVALLMFNAGATGMRRLAESFQEQSPR